VEWNFKRKRGHMMEMKNKGSKGRRREEKGEEERIN
jgi:hypothetical protein